jgi:hypothetical protein
MARYAQDQDARREGQVYIRKAGALRVRYPYPSRVSRLTFQSVGLLDAVLRDGASSTWRQAWLDLTTSPARFFEVRFRMSAG